GKVVNYFSPNESTGLDINCFTEDKEGNIWVGTYGQGIFIFDGKKFTRKYTQNDGIASNYCYLMTKDLNNNIWIGHKTGISKFEHLKKSFSVYQKNSGFLADEVNSNAVSVDNGGNIWFGTSSGLLKYNIKTDKPNLIGPIMNITDLRLFYQHTDWSKYSDSLVGLARLPENLSLPYNKNHLTFNVIGISLSSPEKIKYQYKLEGFEKEWSLLTNTDFVTYSNLPPGDYTFKAKAQNSYGTWCEIPAIYKFKIIAPFWKTPWFVSLAGLCGIILISSIISFRTQSLKRQQTKLQEEKNRLEVEIKQRKRAQKKQKISEEKLKKTNQELNTFIYRASHDLRGPLSTVKGLTQLGIMEVKEEKSLKYFNLISDRISRLDSILKDLIYIVEVTDVTIHPQKIEFYSIINESIEVLKEAYPMKNLNFILEIKTSEDFYNDYNIISTTIKNLIDNSIKYTNPEKEISDIEVKVHSYQKGVKICVIDNGIGIQNDIQAKIFDMFFRGTDQSKGSGLGLYLIKKIVDKLEGEIKVESVYLKGTKMEIYFPSYYQMPADDKVIKSKKT
ncbi:MAG TPA: ATP-binding protein, partial [Cytophagaceae bacterium]